MAVEDLDRERIIAAYADGQDVTNIERQYGVSRDDIERIVVGEDQADAVPPAAEPRRAPAAVMAAVVLVAAVAVIAALFGLLSVITSLLSEGQYGTVAGLVGLAAAALCGLLAYGLLRHQRTAQIGAIAIGAICGLILGVALALLLIAPQSSRDWFARR